jgi:hypothetical protein
VNAGWFAAEARQEPSSRGVEGDQEVMRRKRIDPEARGVVCTVKRAHVMGQRISGQHQGQRTQFSAQEGRRHDRTHDQRNAEINL